MQVTVEVLGDDTYEFDTEALADDGVATYLDLLAAVDLSPHEVSVMVEGRPVPEDQPIATDRVRVLRLIRGG